MLPNFSRISYWQEEKLSVVVASRKSHPQMGNNTLLVTWRPHAKFHLDWDESMTNHHHLHTHRCLIMHTQVTWKPHAKFQPDRLSN